MKAENTPIRRSKELIQLSRDHHDGLLLCWKIRTGLKNSIDKKRITDYVLHFFEHELREHFRQEEEIVFSLLADNDPKKTEVFAQHDILYGIIEKIKEQPSEWQYLLTQFADQLDGHIRFEERELFPYIEQQTEQTVLQEAGKQIDALHKQHTAITWQDEFWIIKK